MTLNGPRGAGLLILALLGALPRGIRYAVLVPSEIPPGITDLSGGGVAIRFLGVLWLVAAAVGVWASFRTRDLPGVFALAFMHALWTAALTAGCLLSGSSWLSPLTVAGTFGLIVCWSRMINPPKVPVEELMAGIRTGG